MHSPRKAVYVASDANNRGRTSGRLVRLLTCTSSEGCIAHTPGEHLPPLTPPLGHPGPTHRPLTHHLAYSQRGSDEDLGSLVPPPRARGNARPTRLSSEGPLRKHPNQLPYQREGTCRGGETYPPLRQRHYQRVHPPGSHHGSSNGRANATELRQEGAGGNWGH